MKSLLNYPRNLRALFGFLRIGTVAVGTLHLVLLVVYPLMGLHLPSPDLAPLAEVWVTPKSEAAKIEPRGEQVRGLELSYVRGVLWYRSSVSDRETDALIRWRFLCSQGLSYVALAVLFDLLWRLCRNVERGAIFVPENIRVVRWLGTTLLMYQALGLVGGMIFARKVSEFLQQNTVAGAMALRGAWPEVSFPIVLTGVLVLLLAEVFRQGVELKEENELTV